MNETYQVDKLSLTDGLKILIQSEMDVRKHNKITRLIKTAGFRQLATIEKLDTHESRGISSSVIDKLSRGEYLKYVGTIVITVPTGTGKSFLASALGERAGYHRGRWPTIVRNMHHYNTELLTNKTLYFFRPTF